MNLTLPSSQKIDHIFHFADVHIRDGDSTRSRFREYLAVINNTISTLKAHPGVQSGSAVSVLVGDTLDHKSKLGGPGCTLFNHFIKGLSECGPVYIIQGNHDFQQAFPDEPSMLDALLINAPPNVHYLEKTGHYIAGSVGFGLVLTRDTLLLGSGAGQLETLPDFPDPNLFPETVKTKIALFHGTIKGCLLQNYHPSQEGYPKDWIKGYDLHLLGDIHLQQITGTQPLTELSSEKRQQIMSWERGKDIWAYPGSLVQQSFGENPFSNHGFLDWDLPSQQVTVRPVHNPWAKLYLKCMDGDWLVSFPEKRWEPLRDALDAGQYKHIEIRIRNRIKSENIKALHETLLTYEPMTYEITNGLLNNHIYDEVEIQNQEGASVDMEEEGVAPLTCEQYNSPQTWIQYVEEHHNTQILEPVADKWRGWLVNPKSLLIKDSEIDPSNKKVAADRNKKIQKIVDELLAQLQQSSSRTHLKIRYLEWNWLLCYGANNWVNFDELTQQIAGAKAANHKGKSAFFDIICLGLFGKPTPLRKSTDGVIHDSKPHGKRPTVRVIVDVNNETYSISREFSKLDSGTTKNVKPMVCRLFKDGYKTIAQGSTVSKWVATNVGDLKDFLLSSMITQVQDQNFIFVGHREQLDILDNSLNLNAYNTLLSLLQETRNAYLSIASKHQTICTKVRSTMVGIDKEAAEKVKKEYEENLETCQKLEKYLNSLQVDTDVLQQTENMPLQLVQKYIQAHESKIMGEGVSEAQEVEQLKARFKQTPNPVYREYKDQLLTLQTQWETHKPYYDPQFQTQTLFEAENKYKMFVNDGTEPSVNQDLLKHEANAIAEWRTKWELFIVNPSCQNALESTLEQIMTVQNEIKNIQQECIQLREKNDLSCLPENESYETWSSRNNDLLLEEEKYQSLQTYCSENPLVNPAASKETIAQMEADLEAELSNLKNPKWRENTPETDQSLYAETQALSLQLKENLSRVQSKIQEAQGLERPAEPTMVKEPSIPPDTCRAWIKDFNTRKDLLIGDKQTLDLLREFEQCKYQKLQSKTDLANTLESKISEIKGRDYPFNPDCEACRKQPWKIELEAVTQDLVTVQAEIQNLQEKELQGLASALGPRLGFEPLYLLNDITEPDFQNKIKQLQASIAKTEEEIVLNRLLEYQTCLEQWTAFHTYVNLQNEYKTRMEEWISNKDKIIGLQAELSLTSKSLANAQQDLDGLKQCLNNRAKWDRTRNECASLRAQWNSYAESQKYHDKLQKMDRVLAEAAAWRIRNQISELDQKSTQLTARLSGLQANEQHYRQFLTEKESMNKREELWNHNNEVWNSWTKLIALRRSDEAVKFHTKMALVENKTQYLQWMLILHNRDLQSKMAEAEKSISVCRETNTQLLKKITTYENSLELFQKQQEECNLLTKQIENLTVTQLAINHLIDIFTDFRQWLYKNKIIPRLLKSANEISDLIVGKDEHKCNLSCNITFGTRKELLLDWRVHSSAGEPSIHYAGGFQKIIYGLALRIAIANIGASSIVCKQFFIDEGFSSADIEHLGRVEVLLNNLLNLYDSIIMVTHIETLQESITTNMTIQRDEQHLTSSLRQGLKPSDSMGTSFARHESKDALPIQPLPIPSKATAPAPKSDGSGRNAETVEIAVQGQEQQVSSGLKNLSDLAKKIKEESQSMSNENSNETCTDQMVQLDPEKCQGIVQSSGKQCRFKKKIGDYCKKHARI